MSFKTVSNIYGVSLNNKFSDRIDVISQWAEN